MNRIELFRAYSISSGELFLMIERYEIIKHMYPDI